MILIAACNLPQQYFFSILYRSPSFGIKCPFLCISEKVPRGNKNDETHYVLIQSFEMRRLRPYIKTGMTSIYLSCQCSCTCWYIFYSQIHYPRRRSTHISVRMIEFYFIRTKAEVLLCVHRREDLMLCNIYEIFHSGRMRNDKWFHWGGQVQAYMFKLNVDERSGP